MGDERIVVYVEPANTNLQALDGSPTKAIRGEIEAFLTAWKPEIVFDKEVLDPVYQIKKDRSVVRAFGAHWNGDDRSILIVLAIYKKKDEQQFWNRKQEFKATADDYLSLLDKGQANRTIDAWLSKARDAEEFKVVTQDS
jgi:hypothetical protein